MNFDGAGARVNARVNGQTLPEDLSEVRHLVVYGDFNCPWSYLASRRAALLSSRGLQIDWRAVEHAPVQVETTEDTSNGFEDLRDELEEVQALLLPGEELPFALAGFLPHTRAAVAAYAEAYATGASAAVRTLLFEALWLHSLDLADCSVVHTLVVDAIRTQPPSGHPLARWEYDAGATPDSRHTTADRLSATWAEEWRSISQGTVPVVLINGLTPIVGTEAVEWLGRQLLSRGPVASGRTHEQRPYFAMW
jgi:hypothetical protein